MALETYDTVYGKIHRLVGGCKDDYDNIKTSKYYRKPSGTLRWRKRATAVTMQGPALEAFTRAEADLGREIKVTGSIRTCELQAQLYRSDPNRFAPPTVGVHCQGLAIDVSTEDPELTTKVRKALTEHKFKQARSDEPWHFSYFVTA